MKADSTNASISVEQGPRSISAIQRRRCLWILVPLISAILTVPCLASVCAGVSIERAFDQADVVIEAKLNTKIPPDKLQTPPTEKEEILYLPVGLTFDVLTEWKGNKTETALI